MKLPTSTKPTSGFHICDILELNKDKKLDSNQNHEQKSHEDDAMKMKMENVNNESVKRRHSPSPSPSKSPIESSRDAKELKKLKKHLRHESEMTADRQLLSDTIHQYPHLFQNHPAMRPWFNSNGEHTNFKYKSR